MNLLLLQIFNGSYIQVLKKIDAQYKALKKYNNQTMCIVINMGNHNIDLSQFSFTTIDLRKYNIPDNYWAKKEVAINVCQQFILDIKPEIVYMRYPLGDEFTEALTTAFPNIVFEHHTLETEELNTYQDKTFYNKELQHGGKAIAKTMAITAVCESIAQYEIKRANTIKKYHIIANGVDEDSFKDLRYKTLKPPYKILSISSFQLWHGLDRLVEGFGLFNKKEKYKIYLVGSGGESGNINKLVTSKGLSKYFEFTGELQSKEIKQLVSDCSIGIGSLGLHRINLVDASPIKHREYILYGLPVVFSCRDEDLSDSLPFIHKYSAEDVPINFNEIDKIVSRMESQGITRQDIHKYGIDNLTWDAKVKKLLSFLGAVLSTKKVGQPGIVLKTSEKETSSAHGSISLTESEMNKLSKWDNAILEPTKEIAEQVLKHLPEGGVFIDIGGNTGMATELVTQKRGCTTHLFEPVPLYFKYCEHKFKDKRNIRLQNAALSDEEGETEFWLDSANLGWNTMESEKLTSGMTRTIVKTMTFDKYAKENNIDRIDVIKLDVEGAEYRVLTGMKNTLSRLEKKPVIICEIGWGKNSHPNWKREEEAFEWLIANGYKRFNYNVEKTSDVVFYPEQYIPVKEKTINELPQLTIGIPTRNRLDSLIRLIDSITKQTFKNFELLISDDGNMYDLEYEIRNRFPDLSFKVTKGKRVSLPVNRQTILDNATCEYVVMCDDDHSMKPDCIEELYNTAITTNAAVVSAIWPSPVAEVIDYNSVKHLEEYRLDLDNIGEGTHFWWKNGWKTFCVFHKSPQLIESQFAGGGCVLYKKEVVKKVGGFPDYYSPVSFREDTDISYRVFLAGFKVIVNPKAIAYHFPEQSGGCRDTKDVDLLRENDGNLFIQKILQWRKDAKNLNTIKVASDYSSEQDLTQVDSSSQFSTAIEKVFRKIRPQRIIETGTYLGEGTTKVIASVIEKIGLVDAKFYSIEINPYNFKKAKWNLTKNRLVKYVSLLNGVSVPSTHLPSKEDIKERTVDSIEYNDIFVDHRENERVEKYFDETNFPGLPEDLLGQCLAEFNYKPDFILLDSGGHMGYIEFNYVLSKLQSDCIIALDDVYHIKHHKSFLFMKQDPRFEIIVESKEKFGFCIAKFTPVIKKEDAKPEYKKETINCLSCGSKLSFPVRENDIVQCLSCGFVYLKERLTTSEMERYYRDVYAVNDPFAASLVKVPKSIEEIESNKEYKGALREELFNEAVKYYNKDIKNKKFIDIGCGWGGLLYTANKNGMKVTGFEFTQPNVEFARNVLGFDIRQQQFDRSDIPANSIDIITMSHVLEHVPEPVSFVKKIYNSLKNGGLFYCVVPNFNSLCSSIEKEEWLWLEREWHYSHFTPNVLKNIFEQAGFTIEKLETVSGDYGSEAPMAALKKTNPKLIDTNDLKLALAEINRYGKGEEIRIIAQKKPGKKQTPGKKNLLWIRTDSIGDAIMSVNMLEKFATNLPEYSVTVVCQEHIKEMYESAPFVNGIFTFNRKKLIDHGKYQKTMAEKIRGTNADLLINSIFSRDVVSDFFVKESGAKVKVGFDGDLSNMTEYEMEKSKQLYDHLISITPELNEMEKNALFLRNLSIDADDYSAKVFLSEKELLFADDFFSKNELNPEKTIAFFAGAQYNIRYSYIYGKAMESSLRKDDYTVVALGGKNDEYINGLNLKDFTGRIIDLTGKTTFKESAAILGKCKLAIGSETSLAHAACALNVPNVIMLGGGHFGRFMPYSELTTIVSLPLDCFNCNWACKHPEVYCVKKIESKTLSEAIKDRLLMQKNTSKAFFQKRYMLDWLGEQPQFVEPQSVNSYNSEVVFVDAETKEFTELNLERLRKEFGLKQSSAYMIQQYSLLVESNSKDFEKYKSIEIKALKSNDVITLLKYVKELDNYPLLLLHGLYEYNNNNLAAAKAILEDLLKYTPNNYRAVLLLAEVSFKQKDHIDSPKLLSHLIQQGIPLGKKELKMLNTSKVVNEARIMNQVTSAKYYELPPEPIKKEIEIANVTSSKISIIIPSKSRSTQLIETLESIINAAFNIDYEVILYLNQNVQFSIEEMTKYHIKCIYYDNEIFPDGKFSWTKLMNHGFKNASGEWLMYGSDDIVFHPFAFNYAFTNPIPEDIGGINFLHRNNVEDYGGFYKNYGFDTYGEKPFINFGLIRKTAYLKTDGFCEDLLFYSGDVDICRQIVNRGYKIIPSYSSLVEHNNTTDKIRSEKSDKIYLDDTHTFISRWVDEISDLVDRKIIKERFIVNDAYPYKSNIYSNCLKYSIPSEKLIEIDKDYSEIEVIEKNKKGDKSKIRVSAIVSVYNSGKFIKGCLEDLTSQTLFNKGLLEIVVVNCGTDKTDEREITKYKSKYPNIIYIKLEDRVGIYKAWNIGVKAASGEFVTNANTDDRHSNDALEKMLSVIDNDNTLDVIYADCYKTEKPNDTFSSSTTKSLIKWVDYDSDLLLFGCFIGPQPLWRKSLHDKFGYFDEELDVVGDYEFWLRISREASFYHLKEPLGLYYYSVSSAEHRNQNLTDKENGIVQNKYISSYINSIAQISMVYKKILGITGNSKDNDYYKAVSHLLERRRQVVELEEEFIKEIKKGFNDQVFNRDILSNNFNRLSRLRNLSLYDERIYVLFELYNALVYHLNNNKLKVHRILKKVFLIYPLQFVAEYLGYDTKEFVEEPEVSSEQFFVEVNQLIEEKNYKAGIEKIMNFLSSLNNNKVEISGQDLELLYNLLGNLFLFEGDYEKAHQSFEEELKLNSSSSRACVGLADTFLAIGMTNESKTMLEWGIKNNPGDDALFQRLVNLNKELGLEQFDYTLSEEVNTLELIRQSEELIGSENLVEAEKILLEIVSLIPSNVDALNNLSVIYILTGNYKAAVSKLERVFSIEPGNEVAADNLNYLNSILNQNN